MPDRRSKTHDTVPALGSDSRVWARVGGGVVILLLLVIIGGIAYLRAWPPLRIVMSPSMEPAIATGDVVAIKAMSPEVGDVVVVEVPAEFQERFQYPPEVVHRIIEITADGLVRTQGDNLAEPDPFGVPVSSVTHGVFTVIPGLGKTLAFLTSPFAIIWLVAGVVIFGVLPFMTSHRDLVGAVTEYGYHLRSHTAILKSMSTAAEDLSATVVELRRAVEDEPQPAAAHRLPTPERGGISVDPEAAEGALDETPSQPPFGMEPLFDPAVLSERITPDPEAVPGLESLPALRTDEDGEMPPPDGRPAADVPVPPPPAVLSAVEETAASRVFDDEPPPPPPPPAAVSGGDEPVVSAAFDDDDEPPPPAPSAVSGGDESVVSAAFDDDERLRPPSLGTITRIDVMAPPPALYDDEQSPVVEPISELGSAF